MCQKKDAIEIVVSKIWFDWLNSATEDSLIWSVWIKRWSKLIARMTQVLALHQLENPLHGHIFVSLVTVIFEYLRLSLTHTMDTMDTPYTVIWIPKLSCPSWTNSRQPIKATMRLYEKFRRIHQSFVSNHPRFVGVIVVFRWSFESPPGNHRLRGTQSLSGRVFWSHSFEEAQFQHKRSTSPVFRYEISRDIRYLMRKST